MKDVKSDTLMSKTIFPPSIKTRPVYALLAPRQGTAHIVIADGEGAEAVAELLAKVPDRAAMLARVHILYTPGPNGTDQWAAVQAFGAAQSYRGPTIPAMLPRMAKVVAEVHMGAQFYLAGSEGLIGLAEREIMSTGFPFAAVQKDHRGSTVRRVQCVHCKGITENVATDPFVCSHCGLNLFVRDHYSRRHAAFQGVNIDAEDPGLVPPAVEKFK